MPNELAASFTAEEVRAGKAAQDRFTRKARAIVALGRARELVGSRVLAQGMGIGERTLRSYTCVERGVPAERLDDAADVLDRQASALIDHAAKLRELAGASDA